MTARYYTKDDVELHSEHGRGRARPAVNVKAYRFPGVYDVTDRWPDVSEEDAEKYLGWAFERHQDGFWEDIQDISKSYGFGEVHSEGRSDGWAVPQNVEPLESWDAIYLGKWQGFEKMAKELVRDLCSVEVVLRTIEANWIDLPPCGDS